MDSINKPVDEFTEREGDVMDQVDEFTEREGDVMELIAEGVYYLFIL